MEVDAQSVVFNAWHLTYFDEAFSAYMADRGLPYEKMIEAGFDDGGGGSDGLGGLFGEGEESQPFCAHGMLLLTHNDWDR